MQIYSQSFLFNQILFINIVNKFKRGKVLINKISCRYSRKPTDVTEF